RDLQFPVQAGIPIDGDFDEDTNGNGTLDLAPRETGINFGLASDTPFVGDWNGDGADDLGTFTSSIATWSLDLNGNRVLDAGEAGFIFGVPGDTGVVGEWNGDGHSDLGAVRTVAGALNWFIDRDGNRRIDPNEDTNGNGVLDAIPNEDLDGDGFLDNDGPF